MYIYQDNETTRKWAHDINNNNHNLPSPPWLSWWKSCKRPFVVVGVGWICRMKPCLQNNNIVNSNNNNNKSSNNWIKQTAWKLLWKDVRIFFWRARPQFCFESISLKGQNTYRVFIKYCVFSLEFMFFFWTLPVLMQRWFSTCLVCVHTLTPRENRERPESGIF